MKDHSDFARIVQKVAPQSRLVGVRPLPGGLSAALTVLEIQMPDGQLQQLVVRQQPNPQVLENQYNLLQMLNTLNLAAPKPRHLGLSGQILPDPFLVLDFVDGEMDFTPNNRASYFQQLAGQLAQIHHIDCANYDLLFLPQSGNQCLEMGRAAAEDSLFGADKIRETLAAVDTPPPINAPVLLHGDFWPGNSLWQDGQLVAVIDWEDAERGDPLIDLAKSRSEVAWIFGIAAMQRFTNHYRLLIAIDDDQLPYWDLCAALRFIRLAGNNLTEWAAYFEPYGRSDITAASIEKEMRYFIKQALEKIG